MFIALKKILIECDNAWSFVLTTIEIQPTGVKTYPITISVIDTTFPLNSYHTVNRVTIIVYLLIASFK